MPANSVPSDLRQHLREATANGDALQALVLARQLLALSNKPAEVLACYSALAKLAPVLEAQAGLRRLRVFIVRSVTLEPALPWLFVEAALNGYVLDVKMGGFGSYADDLLSPSGSIAQHTPDLVIVALDADEIAGSLPDRCATGIDVDIDREIGICSARVEQLLRSFRRVNSARLLLHGLAVPDSSSLGDVGDANLPQSLPNVIADLNRGLARICRSLPDCVFFDIDRIAARHGRRRWRDERMFLSSRLPMASDCFGPWSRGLVRSLSALFRAPRKILCTDLDNTLWGGILGEDGVQGIATGSAYPGNCYLEYQRLLKRLAARGILLAIVSKNNRADVLEAFERRSADLGISLNDFVATKISWDEKSVALRELAEELSLGLDSFVFVDDNRAECAAIQQQLPEVAVLAAPVDEPWRMVELLAEQPFFDAVAITTDDVNRVKEYKAQAQRAELEGGVATREEFLATLEIVCTFDSALDAPLARAVQLLAKTNQFNLTTRRRLAAEVEDFAASPGGQAVAVRVRDRFGDAGVVGLALARTNGDTCAIDSFLLSCRVIGRGIETALLAHVATQARRDGAKRLLGEFIPSNKNSPCATFYPDNGFMQCDAPHTGNTDSLFYELHLNASAVLNPAWIATEGNVSHEHSSSSVVPA